MPREDEIGLTAGEIDKLRQARALAALAEIKATLQAERDGGGEPGPDEARKHRKHLRVVAALYGD